MPYPKANYPVTIWDGLTLNLDRVDQNSNVNPNSEDWERIASEVLALQDNTGPILLPTVTTSGPLIIQGINGTFHSIAVSVNVLVDATSGNLIVNLPTALDFSGKTITLKKIDSTINSVTIEPNSTETIDNELNAVISVQWVSITLVSNGIGWFIL